MADTQTNSFTTPDSRDFTLLQNNLIRSPSLSCKAYKLLSIGLSHSGAWKFIKTQIATCFKEKSHTVDEAMKELRSLGYLHLRSNKNEGGHFKGHCWFWFREPVSEEEFKKRYGNPEIPELRKNGDSENPPDIRRLSNKKTNLKKNNNSVVVFLEKLELNELQRDEIAKGLDKEKAKLLVKRVLAWKDRAGDLVACRTILAKWDSWSDEVPQKEKKRKAEEERRRVLDEKEQKRNLVTAMKNKYCTREFWTLENGFPIEINANNSDFFEYKFKENKSRLMVSYLDPDFKNIYNNILTKLLKITK